jgi:hypothetical protein
MPTGGAILIKAVLLAERFLGSGMVSTHRR